MKVYIAFEDKIVYDRWTTEIIGVFDSVAKAFKATSDNFHKRFTEYEVQ